MIQLSDFHLNSESRAFRYGDGFFESIVTTEGKSKLLSYHCKRINKALFAFNLKSHQNWDIELLQQYIDELLSYAISKDARFRIIFWREAKGLYTPLSNECCFLITYKPLVGKIPSHYENAGFYNDMPLVKSRLSAFKTLNSLPYVMAGIEKQKMGWDEAILLSAEGDISDGSSANIYWIKNGHVYTPHLNTGCIEGVMRCHIRTLCDKTKIALHEVKEKPLMLEQADSLFFSNVTGIYPLMQLGDKIYDTGNPVLKVIMKENERFQ